MDSRRIRAEARHTCDWNSVWCLVPRTAHVMADPVFLQHEQQVALTNSQPVRAVCLFVHVPAIDHHHEHHEQQHQLSTEGQEKEGEE